MDNEVSDEKKKLVLTDWMRIHFKGILDPIAIFLNRLGLHPNTVTLLGLVGNVVGAFFLMRGEMQIGGLIILLMGPIDALDGAMARLRGEPTKFGAFVDSVTDRYSDLVILGGLLLFYLQKSDWLATGIVYAAAAGSMLVPYIRARAESLGYSTKVGILTRFERWLVICIALLLNLPLWGAIILGVFANITAVQRIYDVRSQAHKQMKL